MHVQIDTDALRPLIEQVVAETLERLEADRAKTEGRLAFTESEAAALIGVRRQQSDKTDFNRMNGKRNTTQTLLPRHRVDLESSGLTIETIEAAGIHTEENRDRIAGYLGWKKWAQKNGPVIVFPFFDEHDDVILRRVKPDNPPQLDGKPAKYLSPKKDGVRVYFPPDVRESLANGCTELLITEGEKKALKATQEGFPCIGLTGVDCWHEKGSFALLPDLEKIKWKGLEVFILFDSDGTKNDSVCQQANILGKSLEGRQAKVRIAWPPEAENGDKQGLDDFLRAEGVGALRALLSNAEEVQQIDPDEMKRSGEAIDAGKESQVFIDTARLDGIPRLRYWRERFYYWRNGQYTEVRDSEMRGQLVKHLGRRYIKVKQSHTGGTLDFVKAYTTIPAKHDAPYWIERQNKPEGWNSKHTVATKSHLIHLPDLYSDDQSNAVIPATPAFFNTAACGCDFLSRDTPKPDKWLAFLDKLWPDEPEAIATLQMWFGYCLTPDTSQHKMLCIFGPKRSGKGTIARILKELVGSFNVCSPTLGSLAGPFGRQPLLDKTLGIISDARISGRSDSAVIAERVLSITGEDRITIDRKHQPAIDAELNVRFMLLSNEFPRIADASTALVSRMVILQLKESWYGREDTELTDKLLPELPGILYWAMEGWNNLRESGRFIEPESSTESRLEWEDISSPVGAFVRDCCEICEDCREDTDRVYDAYKHWATNEQGKQHVLDKAGFGRDLRAVSPTIDRKQRRIGDGRRSYFYNGLRLRD